MKLAPNDEEEVDHRMLLDRLHIGISLIRWCLGGIAALAMAVAGSYISTRDDVRAATARNVVEDQEIEALKETDRHVSSTLWEINTTVGRIAGALGVTSHDSRRDGASR